MNWDHLRYFELVADHGSVAAAGRSAGVSHATVLRAIQRLEEELGLRLFDHLRSGYRLTPDGAELREHVASMSREADTILRRAQGKGDEPAGELNVGVPEAGIFDLMPRLADYAQRYPDVTVNVQTSNAMTPSAMLDDDIRIAFFLTNDPPEDLVGRKIDSIRFVAARNKAYSGDPPWIDWSPSFLSTQDASRLRANVKTTRQDMFVSNHESAVAAVRSGLGASLIAEGMLGNGVIQSRGQVDVGIWMLTHPEFRGDARVRALMASIAG